MEEVGDQLVKRVNQNQEPVQQNFNYKKFIGTNCEH